MKAKKVMSPKCVQTKPVSLSALFFAAFGVPAGRVVSVPSIKPAARRLVMIMAAALAVTEMRAGSSWGERVDLAFERALDECGQPCKGGGYTITVHHFRRGGGRDTRVFEDVRAALQAAKRREKWHNGLMLSLEARDGKGHGSASFVEREDK